MKGPRAAALLEPRGMTPVRNPALRDVVEALAHLRLSGRMGWVEGRCRYRRTVLDLFGLTLSTAVFPPALGIVFSTPWKRGWRRSCKRSAADGNRRPAETHDRRRRGLDVLHSGINSMELQHTLRMTDAVAAIIQHEDGRYLMQLRDRVPQIPYGGHWGLFGGSVDPGEAPIEAMRRELWEELEFTPRAASYFTRLDYDLTPLGLRKFYRIFFVTPLNDGELSSLVLHEGSDMRLFPALEILAHTRATPYDAHALWLHANRSQLSIA